VGEKNDECGPLNGRSLSPQQRIPRTAQRFAQSQRRREQDIDVAGLDLLHGADVQVHQLGQFFLCDFSVHSFPANILAESFDLRGLFGI
jgi:hypothetical protein